MRRHERRGGRHGDGGDLSQCSDAPRTQAAFEYGRSDRLRIDLRVHRHGWVVRRSRRVVRLQLLLQLFLFFLFFGEVALAFGECVVGLGQVVILLSREKVIRTSILPNLPGGGTAVLPYDAARAPSSSYTAAYRATIVARLKRSTAQARARAPSARRREGSAR